MEPGSNRRAGQARWPLVAAVGAATLAVDQLTKWWVQGALADGHMIPIVWTLRLNLAYNTGAAFSMGRNFDLTRFLPLGVLVVVGVVAWRSRSTLTRAGAVAVGLILGGAIGNLADRTLRTDGGGLLSGGVIDFIDVQWWPVFNVADMGVVVGGILFALVAYATGSEAPVPPADEPEPEMAAPARASGSGTPDERA